MTTQIKIIDQYFSVVLSIILYTVVPTFKSWFVFSFSFYFAKKSVK